jgi:hypothetical protein
VPSGEDGTGVLYMDQSLWSAKEPYTIDEGKFTTKVAAD